MTRGALQSLPVGHMQQSPVRGGAPLRHYVDQINFDADNCIVTPEQGRIAQVVLTGTAFEVCTIPDHGALAPDRLFAIVDVREVLAAVGLLQSLGPVFPGR